MPQRCRYDPRLDGLIRHQAGLVHRDQVIHHGLTPAALGFRLRRDMWRAVLPEVYLTRDGDLSRRQMLIAALLYAGASAAVDAADACWFHGCRAAAVDPERVFVVAPFGSLARSRDFVVVRRTVVPFAVQHTECLRYVEPAVALIAAARRMSRERLVLAALSDGVQRGLVTYAELVAAHVKGPPRNAKLTTLALHRLSAGVHSAPEADLMLLANSSRILPPMEYNVWIQLPGGRRMCLDALVRSSAVVHETNGHSVHARADLFEDMQERHSVLTAAGFTVLHNPPRRIRLHGKQVLAEIEHCHLRYDGRGLPPGVRVLPIAA